MIYCCGGYHKPQRRIFPLPDYKYKNRELEILICPICGALSVVLTQFNKETHQYETFRPKRKKTAKFLKEMQMQKWEEQKVQYGTKSGAGFVYGVNVQAENGKIYQYAVDFNGSRKLVKII